MASTADTADAAAAQAEHERQYSPSQWSQRLGPKVVVQAHCDACASKSEAAKVQFRCELGVQYGPPDSSREVLDIVHPGPETNAQVTVIYLHGGMWQALGIEHTLFSALALAPLGVTVVGVEYTLAPEATLTQIVDQTRRAVAFCSRRLVGQRLFVVGHSAGAHLAAMLLSTDWTSLDASALPSALKGVVLVSGLFDMEPVRRCSANTALQLTDTEIAELSPQRLDPSQSAGVPVMLAVGEHETDEFKRHTTEYARHLIACGLRDVRQIRVAGHDHFDIVERLCEPRYELTEKLVAFLRLPAATAGAGRHQLRVRRAQGGDLERVAAIYNQSVDKGDATMDQEHKTAEHFSRVIDGFTDRETMLVAVVGAPPEGARAAAHPLGPHSAEEVVGWATLKRYSDRIGYRHAGETSVYVDRSRTGQGVGSQLQDALMEQSTALDYHHLVAKIWARNLGSIRFHERYGFTTVGVQKEIGFCDGVWLDVTIMQCLLSR